MDAVVEANLILTKLWPSAEENNRLLDLLQALSNADLERLLRHFNSTMAEFLRGESYVLPWVSRQRALLAQALFNNPSRIVQELGEEDIPLAFAEGDIYNISFCKESPEITIPGYAFLGLDLGDQDIERRTSLNLASFGMVTEDRILLGASRKNCDWKAPEKRRTTDHFRLLVVGRCT